MRRCFQNCTRRLHDLFLCHSTDLLRPAFNVLDSAPDGQRRPTLWAGAVTLSRA